MPTAPGYADVSIETTYTGFLRPAYITFGVDPVSTDPAQIATDVGLAYNAAGSMISLMDTQTTLSGIRVSLGTDGGGDLVYDAGYATVGGKANSSLPPNCALLVHKNTSRGGRRGRGRMFIPWWVGEGDCDEMGLVSAGVLTTYQTALNVFLTQLGTRNVPMVLLHGPGRTATPGPDVVLSLTPDRLISTQRRRLGR
jgi:hypothetical protein